MSSAAASRLVFAEEEAAMKRAAGRLSHRLLCYLQTRWSKQSGRTL
jgi:hypothetical protein